MRALAPEEWSFGVFDFHHRLLRFSSAIVELIWNTENLFMHKILISMLVFGFVASASLGASPRQTQSQSQAKEEPVWGWFQNCPNDKALAMEVKRNGIVIFHSSFPICQMPRADHEMKILAFSFKGGQAYHAEYHTLPTENIDGNIWLASGDSDALVLGVSFSTKKKILLNTLFVAKPNGISVSEIDRGIVIRTFPLPSK